MAAPDGSITDVLDWVRGDAEPLALPTEGWEERAREALVDEQSKGDAARTTLVAKLEALLDGGDAPSSTPNPDATPTTTVAAEDLGDGTRWYETSAGTFHVPAGSEAEKRLLENNAERIAAP